LIETLLRFEEDMFHDRKRKEHIKSPAQASHKCEGMERHTQGINIPNEDVKVLN
jgi:hypothetical protein